MSWGGLWYSHKVVKPPSVFSYRSFYHPKQKPWLPIPPTSPRPRPLAMVSLLPVSVRLPVLGVPCRWSPTVRGPLCLDSFAWNVSKAHPSCRPAGLHPFWGLRAIPLCGGALLSSPTRPLVDTWVAPRRGLLEIDPLRTRTRTVLCSATVFRSLGSVLLIT